MIETDYYTPEGHYLARPLLLPDVRNFSDLLTYEREWNFDTMSARSGKIARPDLVPEPRYIGHGERNDICDRIMAIGGFGTDPQARNEIGPYCSVKLLGSRRSIAVTATDLVIETVAPRIVTADDHLSFEIIEHADRDRALVILSHGHIIGSHWLAYIDPATIPAPVE